MSTFNCPSCLPEYEKREGKLQKQPCKVVRFNTAMFVGARLPLIECMLAIQTDCLILVR